MVGRLVFDVLWRNRWFYVLSACSCSLAGSCSGWPVAQSLADQHGGVLAHLRGGVGAHGRHHDDEFAGASSLPVTTRDLWRATWIVATVVSAGILLATKTISVLLVLAFGGSPKISAEALLLSALYDFAWAGTMLPLFVARVR